MEESQPGMPESHPADTLDDRSAARFVFFIPAFLLHTGIAGIVCPLGVTLASASLNLRPSYGRYFWPGFILEFLFAALMGYAWTKWLDGWLFGTSRWVWIIPSFWLLLRVLSYRSSDVLAPVNRLQHFLGRVDDYGTLRDQLFVVVPFVCSVSYALGALYRRRRGDVLHQKLKSLSG